MNKTQLSNRGDLQWPCWKRMIDGEQSRAHEDRRNILKGGEGENQAERQESQRSSLGALYGLKKSIFIDSLF